jgi:serine/threonine protein phosphatase PrpC
VDDICYIANVGDSRAVMSKNGGKDIVELTTDHKPNHPNEKKRITESGGKVYQYY